MTPEYVKKFNNVIQEVKKLGLYYQLEYCSLLKKFHITIWNGVSPSALFSCWSLEDIDETYSDLLKYSERKFKVLDNEFKTLGEAQELVNQLKLLNVVADIEVI